MSWLNSTARCQLCISARLWQMLLLIFWSLSAEKLSLKRLIGCSSVGIWCKIVSFGLVWCIAFWYLKKILNNSRILRIFFGVSPRICGSFLRSRWFGAHWCFGWLAFEMTLSDSSRRLNKNWLKRWSLWQKIHENPFLTNEDYDILLNTLESEE